MPIPSVFMLFGMFTPVTGTLVPGTVLYAPPRTAGLVPSRDGLGLGAPPRTAGLVASRDGLDVIAPPVDTDRTG